MSWSVLNSWHGCHKKSAGCLYCYMYRRDARYGLDSAKVYKTSSFDELIKRRKDGSYAYKTNTCFLCMTSDFYIEEADKWRKDIYSMIKERKDINFYVITKRPERFFVSLPEDWNQGYDNFILCPTIENQLLADERCKILLELPVKHKELIIEPMLEKINIEKYLSTHQIEHVTVGGESGNKARAMNFEWVLDIREQCKRNNVGFFFKQTGANFIKDGVCYHIPRPEQTKQARKANIDFDPRTLEHNDY